MEMTIITESKPLPSLHKIASTLHKNAETDPESHDLRDHSKFRSALRPQYEDSDIDVNVIIESKSHLYSECTILTLNSRNGPRSNPPT